MNTACAKALRVAMKCTENNLPRSIRQRTWISVVMRMSLYCLACATVGVGRGAEAAHTVFSGSTPETACFNMGIAPSAVVDVLFLERPLARDVGGTVQAMTGGTASHVQIFAFEHAQQRVCTGSERKPFDNFGFTGTKASLSSVESAILIERNDDSVKTYGAEPIGAFQMTAEAYLRTRDAAISLARQAKYAPLNNVNLEKAVKDGAVAGSRAGSLVNRPLSGFVVGGMQGGRTALSEYEREGRRNPGISDDAVLQMSFPEYNCQYFALSFLMLAQDEPSFHLIQPYRMPGESDAGADVPAAYAFDSGVVAEDSPQEFVPEDSWEDRSHRDIGADDVLVPANPVSADEWGGQEPQFADVGYETDSNAKTPEDAARAFLQALYARNGDKLRHFASDELKEFVEEWVSQHSRTEPGAGLDCILAKRKGPDALGTVELVLVCREQGTSESCEALLDLQMIGGRWRVLLALWDDGASIFE